MKLSNRIVYKVDLEADFIITSYKFEFVKNNTILIMEPND